MAPSRASAVREGGGGASVGVRAGGLLSLVKVRIGVPTLSYGVEGDVGGGVFASRWRTPRGRRSCACAVCPGARMGRSHGHPLVVMVGRVVRGTLRR